MQNVKFIAKDKSKFFPMLKERVDSYFNDNKLSREASTGMVVKTVAMYAIYLVPYFLLISNQFSFWWCLLFGLIMGVGLAGLGLSVMHDANHGAYSTNKLVNRLMGYTMDFIGGSSFNWKLQHNVLHHTYTNIDGMDEDLTAGRVIRFCKHSERKPFHKYQHIYGPFLYGLMTLVWSLYSDYTRLARYVKMGLLKQVNANPTERFVKLTIVKAFFWFYTFALPLMLTDLTLGQMTIIFLLEHYVAGLILSFIFQLAHIMPDAEQPVPQNGVIEEDWAVHQLQTTADFAGNNWLINWYAGGLNFQVEHHLFPGICHVHYKKLSEIVKKTAEDCGLKYNSYPTFGDAVVAHIGFLKKLGTA